ncbi:MAG: toll/interleukin-1 receptor domain-containing protein [Gammaproteobacteria bacterium]
MSRIFLSHSSIDELEAVALKEWLAANGWDDVFLDIDPQRGLAAGERWQETLRRAADRCEAVVFVVTPAWAKSKWCLAEFLLAKSLNKRIFGAILKPVEIGELPTELTAEWQLCHLVGGGPKTALTFSHKGEPQQIEFLTDGLTRLRMGLENAGLDARYFPWPPPDDPQRPPYRGLSALEENDAAIFFGRDAQIVRGLDALRGMRATGVETLFVILGPSGTGKSSFLRAGLLPRLKRDDRHFLPLEVIRPERQPLTGEYGLAMAIHKAHTTLGLSGQTFGAIKAALLTEVNSLPRLLTDIQRAAHNRLIANGQDIPPPTLLLSVDQAEELFNPDATDEARRFLALIGETLRDVGPDQPSLIVAFTIRSDRYEPLQTAPELAGLNARVFDDLKPMPPSQFKEIITGPAHRATVAGNRLEVKPDLVERMLSDCAHGADTLPLLSLTLARLYRDYGSDGVSVQPPHLYSSA